MYTIYLKNSAYKVFVSGVFLLKQCLLNVPKNVLWLLSERVNTDSRPHNH